MDKPKLKVTDDGKIVFDRPELEDITEAISDVRSELRETTEAIRTVADALRNLNHLVGGQQEVLLGIAAGVLADPDEIPSDKFCKARQNIAKSLIG